MKRFLGLALCAASFCIAQSNSVLIRNVTVHPVTGPNVENGSVLVVDGKIEEVGHRLTARSGVRVVDGKGMHLYPGMINAATNVGLAEVESVRDTIDLDEIGEFNPELRAAIAFNPSSDHVPVVRAAGITSLISLPGSGTRGGRGSQGSGSVISGQAALMHLEGWTWEEMEVRQGAVMEMIFPEIRSGGGRNPFAAAAVAAPGATKTFQDDERAYHEKLRHISEFMEEARRYQKAKDAKLPGFQRDLKLEAMGDVIEGKQPLFVRAERERMIKDAIAFSDKEKVKIIIADPHEIGSTGPALKEHNIPVVLGKVFTLPEHDDDSYDAPYTLPNEFYKAGVKLCFGTFDVEFARNVPFEAAQAVAFGLPKDEALKAVTINSAEILGAGALIGSIEKGKVAGSDFDRWRSAGGSDEYQADVYRWSGGFVGVAPHS